MINKNITQRFRNIMEQYTALREQELPLKTQANFVSEIVKFIGNNVLVYEGYAWVIQGDELHQKYVISLDEEHKGGIER